MTGITNQSFEQHASALVGWWNLAGVDTCVSEETVDWFAVRPKVASPLQTQSNLIAMPARAVPAVPETLSAFHEWLEQSQDILEANWVGSRILPTGPQAPRLMVVLDMPDADDRASQPDYLSGDSGRLLEGMLRAIGLRRENIYLCALAIKRPPGGILPQDVRTALATRMRHHISLVAPEALLLLGDGTSRALLTVDAPSPNKNLLFINHNKGKLPGVAAFHPRLMLNQPSAKAECWRALQQLSGVWG